MPHEGAYQEILVRLRSERGELISPKSFVGAAERYGLMTQMDRWVIRTALRSYTTAFAVLGHPRIGMNKSGTSLADDSFLRYVQDQIDASQVAPDRLCFEITETAAVNNLTCAREFISSLRALGCHFALDDFGSGLSSFAYLKHFAVDFIKIDGSFVRSIDSDAVDRTLVEAIGKVAHPLGIHSIAEHLETEAARTRLRESGIDYAQGYLIQPPRPLELTPHHASH